MVITGASRGIGREIALACAKKKANVVLVARSAKIPSHNELDGTLEQVAQDVERVGGTPLIVEADIRNSQEVVDAIIKAKLRFHSIDCLVNNASALCTEKVPTVKQNALMMQVNTLGTANMISASYAILRESNLRHVLTISPPLSTLCESWLFPHPTYTTSKYGMSMITLGYSDTLRANTLWPKKLLKTAATKQIEKATGYPAFSQGLDPGTFANTALNVIESDSTGMSCLDDDLFRVNSEGLDDIFIHRVSQPPPAKK